MTPNFTELAERGRLLFCNQREADDAERSAAVSAAPTVPPAPPQQPPAQVVATRPAPTAPAATLESFRIFDRRDSHPIGSVKVIGNRFVAHDVTGQVVAECHTAHEAMRAVEQSETDAMWATVISEAGHGRHARRPAAPEDNHGWPAAIARAQAEQSNSASSASGQQAEIDEMWTEVITKANAGRGLR
jgi:hypothetical protein